MGKFSIVLVRTINGSTIVHGYSDKGILSGSLLGGNQAMVRVNNHDNSDKDHLLADVLLDKGFDYKIHSHILSSSLSMPVEHISILCYYSYRASINTNSLERIDLQREQSIG